MTGCVKEIAEWLDDLTPETVTAGDLALIRSLVNGLRDDRDVWEARCRSAHAEIDRMHRRPRNWIAPRSGGYSARPACACGHARSLHGTEAGGCIECRCTSITGFARGRVPS